MPLNTTLNATFANVTTVAPILLNVTTVAPIFNITTAPPLTINEAIDEFLNWYYGANGGFPYGFLLMAIAMDIFVISYFLCNKRMLGSLVSFILNTFVMPRDEDIKIKSVTIALLGGHCFFQGIQYVTKNTSIWILEGTLTIRWWSKNPVNRISLSVDGFEYFVYNNSYKYNDLEKLFAEKQKNPDGDGSSSNNLNVNNAPISVVNVNNSTVESKEEVKEETKTDTAPEDVVLPSFYRYAPKTKINIRNGQFYAGSTRLPTFVVLKWSYATIFHLTGDVDVVNKNVDLYRMLFSGKMRDVEIKYIPNPDLEMHSSVMATKLQLDQEDIVDDALHGIRGIFRNMKMSFLDVKDTVEDDLKSKYNQENSGEKNAKNNPKIFGSTSNISSKTVTSILKEGNKKREDLSKQLKETNKNVESKEDEELLGTSTLEFTSTFPSKPKTVHRLWTHSKVEKEKVPIPPQIEMTEINKKYNDKKTAPPANGFPFSPPYTDKAILKTIKEPSVLIAKEVSFSYYWDVPGLINDSNIEGGDLCKTGLTLDFGCDHAKDKCKCYDTELCYGPWADRQRNLIMKYFYPADYLDRKATVMKKGDPRPYASFDVKVTFKHGLLLSLPHVVYDPMMNKGPGKYARDENLRTKTKKEDNSKSQKKSATEKISPEKQRRGTEGGGKGPIKIMGGIHDASNKSKVVLSVEDKLKFNGPVGYALASRGTCGWIFAKIGDSSSIKYTMPWIDSPTGCTAGVNLDFFNVSIENGATYSTIIDVLELNVKIDMDYPLVYNDFSEWRLDLNFKKPTLHLTMANIGSLTNLSSDWGDKPPVPLALFCPSTMKMKLSMTEFLVVTYVNKHNIIDCENDFDENNTITFHIPFTYITITLPYLYHAETMSNMSIDVSMQSTLEGPAQLDDSNLCYATFGEKSLHPYDQIRSGGRVKDTTAPQPVFLEFRKLAINVKYRYHYKYNPNPDFIDLLNLDLVFSDLKVVVLGNAVNSLFILLENITGKNNLPVTSEEFKEHMLNLRSRLAARRYYVFENGNNLDNEPWRYTEGINFNDLETFITVKLMEETQILLPLSLHAFPNGSSVEKVSSEYVVKNEVLLVFDDLQMNMRSTPIYSDMVLNISPINILVPSEPGSTVMRKKIINNIGGNGGGVQSPISPVLPSNSPPPTTKKDFKGFLFTPRSNANTNISDRFFPTASPPSSADFSPPSSSLSRQKSESKSVNNANPIAKKGLTIDGISYHAHDLFSKWATAPPCWYRHKDSLLVGDITGDLTPGQCENISRSLDSYNLSYNASENPWSPPTLGRLVINFTKVETHDVGSKSRRLGRKLKIILEYNGFHKESKPAIILMDGVADWKSKGVTSETLIFDVYEDIKRNGFQKPMKITVVEYLDDMSNRFYKIGEKMVTDIENFVFGDEKEGSHKDPNHLILCEVPNNITRGGYSAVCKIFLTMSFDETDKADEIKESNIDEKVLLSTSKMDEHDKQKEEWRSDGKISSNYIKNLQGQIIAEDIASSLSLRFGHRTSNINIKSVSIRFWLGISETILAKKTEIDVVLLKMPNAIDIDSSSLICQLYHSKRVINCPPFQLLLLRQPKEDLKFSSTHYKNDKSNQLLSFKTGIKINFFTRLPNQEEDSKMQLDFLRQHDENRMKNMTSKSANHPINSGITVEADVKALQEEVNQSLTYVLKALKTSKKVTKKASEVNKSPRGSPVPIISSPPNIRRESIKLGKPKVENSHASETAVKRVVIDLPHISLSKIKDIESLDESILGKKPSVRDMLKDRQASFVSVGTEFFDAVESSNYPIYDEADSFYSATEDEKKNNFLKREESLYEDVDVDVDAKEDSDDLLNGNSENASSEKTEANDWDENSLPFFLPINVNIGYEILRKFIIIENDSKFMEDLTRAEEKAFKMAFPYDSHILNNSNFDPKGSSKNSMIVKCPTNVTNISFNVPIDINMSLEAFGSIKDLLDEYSRFCSTAEGMVDSFEKWYIKNPLPSPIRGNYPSLSEQENQLMITVPLVDFDAFLTSAGDEGNQFIYRANMSIANSSLITSNSTNHSPLHHHSSTKSQILSLKIENTELNIYADKFESKNQNDGDRTQDFSVEFEDYPSVGKNLNSECEVKNEEIKRKNAASVTISKVLVEKNTSYKLLQLEDHLNSNSSGSVDLNLLGKVKMNEDVSLSIGTIDIVGIDELPICLYSVFYSCSENCSGLISIASDLQEQWWRQWNVFVNTILISAPHLEWKAQTVFGNNATEGTDIDGKKDFFRAIFEDPSSYSNQKKSKKIFTSRKVPARRPRGVIYVNAPAVLSGLQDGWPFVIKLRRLLQYCSDVDHQQIQVAIERVRNLGEAKDIQPKSNLSAAVKHTNNAHNNLFGKNETEKMNFIMDEERKNRNNFKSGLIDSRYDPKYSGISSFVGASRNTKVNLPNINIEIKGPPPPSYFLNLEENFTAKYTQDVPTHDDVVFVLNLKGILIEAALEDSYNIYDGVFDQHLESETADVFLSLESCQADVFPGCLRLLKAFNDVTYTISFMPGANVVADEYKTTIEANEANHVFPLQEAERELPSYPPTLLNTRSQVSRYPTMRNIHRPQGSTILSPLLENSTRKSFDLNSTPVSSKPLSVTQPDHKFKHGDIVKRQSSRFLLPSGNYSFPNSKLQQILNSKHNKQSSVESNQASTVVNIEDPAENTNIYSYNIAVLIRKVDVTVSTSHSDVKILADEISKSSTVLHNSNILQLEKVLLEFNGIMHESEDKRVKIEGVKQQAVNAKYDPSIFKFQIDKISGENVTHKETAETANDVDEKSINNYLYVDQAHFNCPLFKVDSAKIKKFADIWLLAHSDATSTFLDDEEENDLKEGSEEEADGDDGDSGVTVESDSDSLDDIKFRDNDNKHLSSVRSLSGRSLVPSVTKSVTGSLAENSMSKKRRRRVSIFSVFSANGGVASSTLGELPKMTVTAIFQNITLSVSPLKNIFLNYNLKDINISFSKSNEHNLKFIGQLGPHNVTFMSIVDEEDDEGGEEDDDENSYDSDVSSKSFNTATSAPPEPQILPGIWIRAEQIVKPNEKNSGTIKEQHVFAEVGRVSNSVDPTVLHQFLALQSRLSKEINILLESIAKFAEQKKNALILKTKILEKSKRAKNKGKRKKLDEKNIKEFNLVNGLNEEEEMSSKDSYEINFKGFELTVNESSSNYGSRVILENKSFNVLIVYQNGNVNNAVVKFEGMELKMFSLNNLRLSRDGRDSRTMSDEQIEKSLLSKIHFDNFSINYSPLRAAWERGLISEKMPVPEGTKYLTTKLQNTAILIKERFANASISFVNSFNYAWKKYNESRNLIASANIASEEGGLKNIDENVGKINSAVKVAMQTQLKDLQKTAQREIKDTLIVFRIVKTSVLIPCLDYVDLYNNREMIPKTTKISSALITLVESEFILLFSQVSEDFNSLNSSMNVSYSISSNPNDNKSADGDVTVANIGKRNSFSSLGNVSLLSKSNVTELNKRKNKKHISYTYKGSTSMTSFKMSFLESISEAEMHKSFWDSSMHDEDSTCMLSFDNYRIWYNCSENSSSRKVIIDAKFGATEVKVASNISSLVVIVNQVFLSNKSHSSSSKRKKTKTKSVEPNNKSLDGHGELDATESRTVRSDAVGSTGGRSHKIRGSRKNQSVMDGSIENRSSLFLTEINIMLTIEKGNCEFFSKNEKHIGKKVKSGKKAVGHFISIQVIDLPALTLEGKLGWTDGGEGTEGSALENKEIVNTLFIEVDLPSITFAPSIVTYYLQVLEELQLSKYALDYALELDNQSRGFTSSLDDADGLFIPTFNNESLKNEKSDSLYEESVRSKKSNSNSNESLSSKHFTVCMRIKPFSFTLTSKLESYDPEVSVVFAIADAIDVYVFHGPYYDADTKRDLKLQMQSYAFHIPLIELKLLTETEHSIQKSDKHGKTKDEGQVCVKLVIENIVVCQTNAAFLPPISLSISSIKNIKSEFDMWQIEKLFMFDKAWSSVRKPANANTNLALPPKPSIAESEKVESVIKDETTLAINTKFLIFKLKSFRFQANIQVAIDTMIEINLGESMVRLKGLPESETEESNSVLTTLDIRNLAILTKESKNFNIDLKIDRISVSKQVSNILKELKIKLGEKSAPLSLVMSKANVAGRDDFRDEFENENLGLLTLSLWEFEILYKENRDGVNNDMVVLLTFTKFNCDLCSPALSIVTKSMERTQGHISEQSIKCQEMFAEKNKEEENASYSLLEIGTQAIQASAKIAPVKNVTGKISFTSGSILLNVYRNSFNDKVYAACKLDSLYLDCDQVSKFVEGSSVQDVLRTVNMCVDKAEVLNVEKSDQKDKKPKRKEMFKFPPSQMLVTTQFQDKPINLPPVVFIKDFYSEFSGKIDVTTNYRDYNLILDILSMYTKELYPLDDLKTDEKMANDSNKNNSQNRRQSVFAIPNAYKIDDRGKAVRFVLEPRLDVLGGLSTGTSVENILHLLGSDKNTIVKICHETVGDNLFMIFESISGLVREG